MTDSSQSEELERMYQSSWAVDFGIDRAEFAAMLDASISRTYRGGCSQADRRRYLEDLRINDLMLARACALGNEKAWAQFLTTYRSRLYGFATAIARCESVGRELADTLYADLFGVRDEGGSVRSCKLNSYSGRGSLEGWLKSVLAQAFVDQYRSGNKLVSLDENVDVVAQAEALGSLDQSEHKKLENATDKALDELSEEERFIMAAYHLDGHTLAEIGRMLCTHESTVSRRLERLRRTLRKRIMENLKARGVSKALAEEMLNVDVRDLAVDVRSRLAQGTRSESFQE